MGILRNRLPVEIKGGAVEGIVVVKRYRDKDVLTAFPDMSKVIFSIRQLESQRRFREAVAFAKAVCADPAQKAKYEEMTKPGQKVYHAVLSFILSQARAAQEVEESFVWVVTASGEKYKLKNK
jgi:hypothetical protein